MLETYLDHGVDFKILELLYVTRILLDKTIYIFKIEFDNS